MISYAQNREDVMLARALAATETGFYVDVGAHHPTHWSVTKHFYQRGWRGINMEPGPMFPILAADRRRDVNLNIALADHQGTASLYEFPPEMGVSTMDAAQAAHQAEALTVAFTQRDVPIRTLADVCREHVHGTIDFLSIDVEGFERQVIAGGDWRTWRPRIVLVEATAPNEPRPTHEAWEPLLLENDYLFAYFDGLNRFYVRAEDRPLAEAFRVPPNVFDRYEIHEHAEHVAALKRQHEEKVQWLSQRLQRQDEQLDELHHRVTEFENLGRLPLAVARRLHRLTARFPKAYTALKRAGRVLPVGDRRGAANRHAPSLSRAERDATQPNDRVISRNQCDADPEQQERAA